MNSTMSTSRSDSQHIGQRYHPYLSLLFLLMLCCASKAEAVVDISLIVNIFDSHTPMVSAANQKAELVITAVLPELIRSDDAFAARLGFTNSNDVIPGAHSVTLTIPYPVVIVDLDQLQGAQLTHPGIGAGIALIAQDTNWLIRTNPDSSIRLAPAQYLYPIQVDHKVASSVMLAVDQNELPQWNIHRIGSSKLIRQVYELQHPGGHFLVQVPALNRYYLGSIAKGLHPTFTLTAIFDDPTISMSRGDSLPALTVFKRLKLEAVRINLTDPNYPPR